MNFIEWLNWPQMKSDLECLCTAQRKNVNWAFFGFEENLFQLKKIPTWVLCFDPSLFFLTPSFINERTKKYKVQASMLWDTTTARGKKTRQTTREDDIVKVKTTEPKTSVSKETTPDRKKRIKDPFPLRSKRLNFLPFSS